MPSSSSARRRRLSVRGLIPSSERSSSQKRERPSARSRTRSSVHFAQTTSAVAQTGQVSLVTPNTLPNEVSEKAQKERAPPERGPFAALSHHALCRDASRQATSRSF